MTSAAVSDKVVAQLRTYVPVWWGALVSFLLAHQPTIAQFFFDHHIDINSVAAQSFITGVVIAIWYAVFKTIEGKMPPWLTRLVLGSNLTPTYIDPTDDDLTTADTLPLVTDDDLEQGDIDPDTLTDASEIDSTLSAEVVEDSDIPEH